MSDSNDCTADIVKPIMYENTEFDKVYQLWTNVHDYIRERPLSSGIMTYDTFDQFYDFYQRMSMKHK